MKLQAVELPIFKPHQPRKNAPIIGALIALTLLFTIIPLYYPSLHYSVKRLIETSFSYDHVDDSVNPTGFFQPLVEQNNLPCRVDEAAAQPCNGTSRGDVSVKSVPSNNGDRHDEAEVIGSPPSSSNAGHLTATKSSDKDHSQTWPSDPKEIQKSPENTRRENCDIFSGEWVPNPEAPYYTNTTCWAIQQHQNCMKFGRPDTGFMKWRWKPDDCELPVFVPHQFLELVRGKSLAFVGDSVARNHMQSLICLLSRVVYPIDASNTKDENFKRWIYPDYDFNISIFWSPYLVRTERTDPNDISRPFKLFLDEFDEDNWTTKIEGFDYVIISAGQWFMRPTIFYENRQLVGCLYCPHTNVTHLTKNFSYQRAFRTAFKAINSLEKFKGVTLLRTFVPSHFEGGAWNESGNCVRTRPFKRNETVLNDENLELYKIQLQELRVAEEEGKQKGLRFRLFDATQAMLLRPDGHPSKYGYWPVANVTYHNDCVHWCLPGPIDTWNDFLQELLRREVQDI